MFIKNGNLNIYISMTTIRLHLQRKIVIKSIRTVSERTLAKFNKWTSFLHLNWHCGLGWRRGGKTNVPFTCSQTRTWYTACYVAILNCSWEAQTISLKNKCHLHQLSSGVKFIQTCWSWHRITFSHHTMHTKGNDSRHSDKDLTDPIFGVLVGDQKTTPPPVLTLCALSEPPATLVSFITGLDGSAATSGVPPLQELGLSPPKGQWCCPEASSPRARFVPL